MIYDEIMIMGGDIPLNPIESHEKSHDIFHPIEKSHKTHPI